MSSLPAYLPLVDYLLSAGTYLEACEIHGMLCGFICNGLLAPNTVWMNLLLLSTHEGERDAVERKIQHLFEGSLQQLSSFGFEFDLLLPEFTELSEHSALSRGREDGRLLPLSKLSQWCEYFLMGLSATTKKTTSKDSRSASEAEDDIRKISRIYPEVLQSKESFNEDTFMELLEHVKVAVMLIFLERNGRTQPTKH